MREVCEAKSRIGTKFRVGDVRRRRDGYTPAVAAICDKVGLGGCQFNIQISMVFASKNIACLQILTSKISRSQFFVNKKRALHLEN